MDTPTNEDNGQWHEVSVFKRVGRIGGGGLVSGKFIVFFFKTSFCGVNTENIK